MKRHLVVVGILASCLLTVVLSGTTRPDNPDDFKPVPDIPKLKNLPREEAFNLAIKLTDDHDWHCGQLREQLRDPECTDDMKALIYFTLGELRDPKAVGILIQDITFRPKWMGSNKPFQMALWGQPAREALVRIGLPSVQGAFLHLKEVQTPERQALLCDVIACVISPKVGRFMLNEAINAEADPTIKARLQACEKLIKYPS